MTAPTPFTPTTSQPGYPHAYGVAPQPALTRPPLAGWWRRVGALLLDSSLPYLFLIPALLLTGATGAEWAVALGLAFAVMFFCWQLVVQGRTGQTLGKRVLGIRALREADGQPMGVGTSFGRSFLHVLDALPLYIGYLWPLRDVKKQTFADKIVNTVVVKA